MGLVSDQLIRTIAATNTPRTTTSTWQRVSLASSATESDSLRQPATQALSSSSASATAPGPLRQPATQALSSPSASATGQDPVRQRSAEARQLTSLARAQDLGRLL